MLVDPKCVAGATSEDENLPSDPINLLREKSPDMNTIMTLLVK